MSKLLCLTAPFAHHLYQSGFWDNIPVKQREPLFVEWAPFQHPQLGLVEVGGLMETYHMNPMMCTMRPIMSSCHRCVMEHARMHPDLVMESLSVDPCGNGVYHVRAQVANRGVLPTHVTNKALELQRFEPVRLSLACDAAAGVQLLSDIGHVEVGHLAGITGNGSAEWFVQADGDSSAAKGLLLGKLHVTGACGGDFVCDVQAPTADGD